MSGASIAFGSAVIGALVGGFAAAGGSDWAQRRQLRRAARIHMFDDLLSQWDPRAGVALRPGRNEGPKASDILDALRRSAVIAGKRETELVREMRNTWEAFAVPPTHEEQKLLNPNANPGGSDFREAYRSQEKASMAAAVAALSDYLEEKLS